MTTIATVNDQTERSDLQMHDSTDCHMKGLYSLRKLKQIIIKDKMSISGTPQSQTQGHRRMKTDNS